MIGEYPTDEELDTIIKWTFDKEWRLLMEYIHKLWWAADWGWREEDTEDDIHGPVHRYDISTGGWSGNESLISAMRENPNLFWSMCWVQSRRGGHYIFETRRIKEPDGSSTLPT